jgi:hypothetical protein
MTGGMNFCWTNQWFYGEFVRRYTAQVWYKVVPAAEPNGMITHLGLQGTCIRCSKCSNGADDYKSEHQERYMDNFVTLASITVVSY